MKKWNSGGSLIKIILHFLAWTILLGLPLYFFKRWDAGNDFIWFYYINAIIFGTIFYSNYLLIVPRFFFKPGRFRYYLSALTLLICFYFVSDISNRLIFRFKSDDSRNEITTEKPERREGFIPPPGPAIGKPGPPPYRTMHFFNYISTSVFLVFFSLGLRVLERQSEMEKMQKETEKERLNSELAFLKNQISPHFFFNTLNNIYSLISINAEDSQKAVLKLSKLMRYLLYESEQGNTKLGSEIDFMINYIDLMKLRMSEKVTLKVSFPDSYEDKNIPPLLFVPFVENCFKHGISYRDKSFIDITMKIKGNTLSFICINSVPKLKREKEEMHSGIGLENVKKRLDLLFPGKYDLAINSSEQEFEVRLMINLS
jgi:hypothetical protein